jgi:hypothetical protein
MASRARRARGQPAAQAATFYLAGDAGGARRGDGLMQMVSGVISDVGAQAARDAQGLRRFEAALAKTFVFVNETSVHYMVPSMGKRSKAAQRGFDEDVDACATADGEATLAMATDEPTRFWAVVRARGVSS